jgi:phage-related protein
MAKELVFDVKVNNLDSTQKTFGQLKQEVKDLRKELESAPIGSQRFDELTAKIQEAGFEMKEIKKDLKEMSSASQQLGDLSEGASAIARGFAMATSAAALFGEENQKAAEEAIKNIVALTSLAEGLGQLPQMMQGLGKAFDVLKANPFMAIAGAVIALLAATGNLNDIMAMLGEVFDEVMSSLQPVIDELMALLSDALGPIMDLLMPLIKLALIPLITNFKLVGVVLEALMPVLNILVEGIELLAGVLTDIVNSVVGAVDAFMSFIGLGGDVDKTNKKTKVSFDDLKKSQDEFRASNDLVNKGTQRQIDLMKAQGKSIDEIEQKELNLIKTKLSQAEAELKIAKAIKDRLILEGKPISGDQMKAFTDIEQNFLDLKNQVAIKEADIDKRKKEESKKNFDKRVEDGKKAYADLLKSQQDFIAQSSKNLDQEYIKKETDLLMQFGDGRIKTEKDLNDKINQLSIDKINAQKTLLQQEITDINNNDKIKAEDKIKLTTQLGDQLIKLDAEIAKKGVENRKKIDAENKLNEEKTKKDEEDTFQKRYGQERLDLIQKFANGEIKTKEELNRKLAELDLQKAKDELSRLDVNSAEYIAKQTDIVNMEIALKQQVLDDEKKINDERRKNNKEYFNESLDFLKLFGDETSTVTDKASAGFAALSSTIREISSVMGEGLGKDVLVGLSTSFDSISGFITKLGDDTASMTDKISAGIGMASEIVGSIGNILAANSERNLEAIATERDTELAALEERKTKGIISDQEYEKAKEKINENARKKELAAKKKAFQQDKAIRIVQAIMSTAQGVVAALANVFPLNIIMAALAGVTGAVQIGLIASQKFPEGGGGGGSAPSTSIPSVGDVSGAAGAAATESADLSKIKAPTFGPNTGAMGGASGVAGGAGGGSKAPEPQRVYVVETDITSTQNRVEVVEERAKIG